MVKSWKSTILCTHIPTQILRNKYCESRKKQYNRPICLYGVIERINKSCVWVLITFFSGLVFVHFCVGEKVFGDTSLLSSGGIWGEDICVYASFCGGDSIYYVE